MEIYLLLPLPWWLATIWPRRLSIRQLRLLWALSIATMSALMPTGSRDFSTYLRDYDAYLGQSLSALLIQDPLYATAVWTLGHLGVPGPVFYLGMAALGLYLTLTAVHRISKGHAGVLALFMSSFFYLHDFTQIRAGLAIGIWLHALARLPDGPRGYLGLTLLATLIHVQASLGLLLYGLARLTRTPVALRLWVLTACALIGLSQTRVFDDLGFKVLASIPDPRVAIYMELASLGLWVRPNPFSVLSLLAILTALAGWLQLERRKRSRAGLAPQDSDLILRYVVVGLLFGAVALSVLASIAVAAFRISEHFFALIPTGVYLVMERMRLRKLQPLVIWSLCGVLTYVFVFHSPYLLDPGTGEPPPSQDEA